MTQIEGSVHCLSPAKEGRPGQMTLGDVVLGLDIELLFRRMKARPTKPVRNPFGPRPRHEA